MYQASCGKYVEVSREQLPDRHPVAVFARYWSAKRDVGTCLPCRSDLKPSEMLSAIPWLLILERCGEAPEWQFRYRLAGTGCTELFGVDYTNRLLGENIDPEAMKIRRQEFFHVLNRREPVFSRTPLPIPDREFITAYRGVFPVTTDGSEADQIFCVIAADKAKI